MSSRRERANAIRALSMDAVQRAGSGHPGAPMGQADMAEVLWNDYLRHNPCNPRWADRDRFVLSNGHGSMLIYALLHLAGYDLSIDALKNFRQLHSGTPGHPEVGEVPGVETTTGPLGQGLANAVGMALAEKVLGAQFNRPGHTIVDHRTYVFLGDGCLMEGISHEVCSLAGTWGLGKLICLYDDNNISIDGEVRGSKEAPGWFTDDTPQRFAAYGWQVIPKVDGHDAEAVAQALDAAHADTDRPTLICCQTRIGFGSPNKEGREACHGAPLGEEEVALTRERLGWDSPPFEIPQAIQAEWDARECGEEAEQAWRERFATYRQAFPEDAAEFERRMAGELPAHWADRSAAVVAEVIQRGESIASRKASQKSIEGFAPLLPEILGGSADLAASNLTSWSGSRGISSADPSGNTLYYGVREFGMAAIMNGVQLHGGLRAYGATFLVFSDYERNALRMAALMGLGSIHLFTHDSIGLGEDGPTHQPVEQIAALRMVPGMSVWRPCDAVETAIAWKLAVERTGGPTSLILSRQSLPHMARSERAVDAVQRGGYILRDCEGLPEAIIIATGSEVALAMEAAEALGQRNRRVRVVSMPSSDTFDAQTEAYRESVLPAAVAARVSVEAGVTAFWGRYVGLGGESIGIDQFGASAPAAALYNHFGITTEAVVGAVERVL